MDSHHELWLRETDQVSLRPVPDTTAHFTLSIAPPAGVNRTRLSVHGSDAAMLQAALAILAGLGVRVTEGQSKVEIGQPDGQALAGVR